MIYWSLINCKHQWLHYLHNLLLISLLFIKEHGGCEESHFSVFLLVYKFLYQELLHYFQGWQTMSLLVLGCEQEINWGSLILRLLLALLLNLLLPSAVEWAEGSVAIYLTHILSVGGKVKQKKHPRNHCAIGAVLLCKNYLEKKCCVRTSNGSYLRENLHKVCWETGYCIFLRAVMDFVSEFASEKQIPFS